MEDPFKNELSMKFKAIFRIDGGPYKRPRFWVTFMIKMRRSWFEYICSYTHKLPW